MSQSPSLLRNSAVIMLCRPVSALVSLVVVPVLIKQLGVGGYGTWEFFFAIGSLLGMIPQAVAATILWRVSECFGANDLDGMRRNVKIGAAALVVAVPIAAAVGIAISPFLLAHVGGEKALPANSSWVLPALIVVMLVSGFNDLLGTIIAGSQRVGDLTVIQTASLAFNYAVAIALVLSGYGLAGLLIGNAAGAVFTHVLVRVKAGKLCASPSLLPCLPTVEERRKMSRYGGLLLLGYGSQALRDQTDKIVLSVFASTTWAGYYGVATRLAGLVLEVNRFFYNPLLAAAGAANGAGKWDEVRRLYSRMTSVICGFAGVVIMIVLGLHERFIMMWIGHRLPESERILAILLCGNAFAVILTGPGTAICRAVGKVYIESYYVAFSLLINLFLTVGLIYLIGPMGTVVASGASWAIASVIFTLIVHRHIDLPTAPTVRARWTTAMMLGCAFLLAVLSHHLPYAVGRLPSALWILAISLPASFGFLAIMTVVGLLPSDWHVRTAAAVARKAPMRLSRAAVDAGAVAAERDLSRK